MWTNFNNSFTAIFSDEPQKRPKYILPPHLTSVATVFCEIKFSTVQCQIHFARIICTRPDINSGFWSQTSECLF